jgi:predicted dithiol-disulfide oxidoreductase (DUF899 family)
MGNVFGRLSGALLPPRAYTRVRRQLPSGGMPSVDYSFEELLPGSSQPRTVRLSELFAPGHDSLVIYSYMFGPAMPEPCPSCTSILDSLDGAVTSATQRISLAIVAKSPIERIQAFGRTRGWTRLRLLSSAGNSYNADYHGESADGNQQPMLNVFVKQDGVVRHFYATELLYAPADPGQDPRHVDAIWPLWSLFDYTPIGRGDFQPRLSYEPVLTQIRQG